MPEINGFESLSQEPLSAAPLVPVLQRVCNRQPDSPTLELTWDILEQLLAPYGFGDIVDVQFTSDGVTYADSLRDRDSTIVVVRK